MGWLWLIGALVLIALFVFVNSRLELTRWVPWIDFGGQQPPDVNAMRVLESEVTNSAGVHPPKDPAP
jgi:hypothetical protein